MADDATPDGAAAAAAAIAAAGTATPTATAEATRIAGLESKVDALVDAFRTAMAPKAPIAPGDGTGRAVLTPQMRGMLRQQGLSDPDIDALAPQIMPFLAALVATDGMALMGEIAGTKEEVALLRAARDPKRFPHFALLADEIDAVRDAAAKAGRPLTVRAAYETAVAGNIDKIAEARETAKARTLDADTASDLPLTDHGGKTRQQGSRRTALTATEIAMLPAAERKKVWDIIGDLPIRN